ncbi:MAG: type II toxin-antitoxin system VapC family toxin, partial [Candidatus Binatia bacterium]
MPTGEAYLLDSVILIDHFNGIAAATEFLSTVGDRAQVSAITRSEVLTGFDDLQLAAPRALLDTFPL